MPTLRQPKIKAPRKPAVDPTLAMPKGLGPKGRLAYRTIMAVLKRHDLDQTGGCRTFWTPTEWKAKGEQYGLTSKLIVVYDGGSVGMAFDYDKAAEARYKYLEAMNEALKAVGLNVECCTCWYAAVYEA